HRGCAVWLGAAGRGRDLSERTLRAFGLVRPLAYELAGGGGVHAARLRTIVAERRVAARDEDGAPKVNRRQPRLAFMAGLAILAVSIAACGPEPIDLTATIGPGALPTPTADLNP